MKYMHEYKFHKKGTTEQSKYKRYEANGINTDDYEETRKRLFEEHPGSLIDWVEPIDENGRCLLTKEERESRRKIHRMLEDLTGTDNSSEIEPIIEEIRKFMGIDQRLPFRPEEGGFTWTSARSMFICTPNHDVASVLLHSLVSRKIYNSS